MKHKRRTGDAGRRPPFCVCLLGWITSSRPSWLPSSRPSWLPSSRPSWLLSWLPFVYSPYRLDIEAARTKHAANECIVLMKIHVKKNRSWIAIFLQEEVDLMRTRVRRRFHDEFCRASTGRDGIYLREFSAMSGVCGAPNKSNSKSRSRFPSGMQTKRNRQGQRQKRIPFGNDKRKLGYRNCEDALLQCARLVRSANSQWIGVS